MGMIHSPRAAVSRTNERCAPARETGRRVAVRWSERSSSVAVIYSFCYKVPLEGFFFEFLVLTFSAIAALTKTKRTSTHPPPSQPCRPPTGHSPPVGRDTALIRPKYGPLLRARRRRLFLCLGNRMGCGSSNNAVSEQEKPSDAARPPARAPGPCIDTTAATDQG